MDEDASAMRQRLVQVLEKDEGHEPMDAVVRRFWSHTTLATKVAEGRGGQVVDLAAWALARGARR